MNRNTLIFAFLICILGCKVKKQSANEVPGLDHLKPHKVQTLADTLRQSSGLVFWNGSFWTHNDTWHNALFELDTNGSIKRIVEARNAENGNWEDLTQDKNYFYIGNFGNNTHGARKDLCIYRIPKKALLTDSGEVDVDTIHYSYADQKDFTQLPPNQTDYDCEAFVALGDSLYLFTKQWKTPGTKVYALPNKPGKYVARAATYYKFDGLVTGAATLPEKHLVVLCGYNTNRKTFLNPFILILQGYTGKRFFSGRIQRVELNQPFHQVESIALTPDGRCFITNEAIDKYILHIKPKLQEIRIDKFLQP